jgi:photosystem II stability/assembly factor-like uncharacterized protein
MRTVTSWIARFFLAASLVALCLVPPAVPEDKPATTWQEAKIPFRALNTTSSGASLWVCGTGEGIAVSSDGGEHWEVRQQKVDGPVLLSINFADEKFGYAAGVNGSLLMTEDGGQNWTARPAARDAILQVSFSDPRHGLIRTFSSLLFTADGGITWSEISAGENADQMKTFRFTFSLVALDAAHMAVMLKEGTAQYEPQAFLFTQDGGKSWKFLNIPNVTLYSFFRMDGKYWTVGTEVIHKTDQGGGYSVPVALFSSDGTKWEHADGDLSACKLENCIACNKSGCLSANGTITNFFSGKTSYREFPLNEKLTTTWAAADSSVCFVGSGLQCAIAKSVEKPSPSDFPLPTTVAPGPLGAATGNAPHCIVCTFDRVFIDSKAQGMYSVKLALGIGSNGIVDSAVAEGAPTPEIKSRIEQQAQTWIFEPYQKDGGDMKVEFNTGIFINVVRPH